MEQIQPGSRSSVLTIRGEIVLSDVHIGDSIAVNGVCLTVVRFDKHQFTADVMHETLRRSSLGRLRPGDHVNLERALAADGRFGGHIVSGHIDGIGEITKTRRDDISVWYTIKAEPQVIQLIVEKGSIAIDGISLTVAKVSEQDFQVSVIPHTASATTLSEKRPGSIVNLENDVIGKYVQRLLYPEAGGKLGGGITKAFLRQYGY